MNKSLKNTVVTLLAGLACSAFAGGFGLGQPHTTQQGHVGGSLGVQTTTVSGYTTKGGTSIGGFSTTTVKGNVAQDGSGNFVPGNTRGSSSSTGHGIGVTIPFGNFGK